MPARVAFVMELGLGHTTVFKMFQNVVGEDPNVVATWIPIEFTKPDLLSKIPKIRHDIVARGGFYGWRDLRRALRSNDFDAMFFHTQMIAVFCGHIMRRIPSIVSIDATPSQFAAMGEYYGLGDIHRTSLKERVRERWYRDVFTSAKRVVSISEWAAEAVRREYGLNPSRTRVVYPGVDLTKWTPGSKASDGPIRLLFVGGEFRRKGGDLLLRWMNEGGSGRATLDVVTGASSEVASTPGVTVHRGLGPNDPRLIELYRNADLFVLPTRADAASLVAMEAMASGTPVLTTRMGAITEWVGASERGSEGASEGADAAVVVPPDDYAALRNALDTLVADRPRLRAMGQRARARAESVFDARANMKKQVALIREVAAHETSETSL